MSKINHDDRRRPLRVLLLEDSEDDAALICLELERAGFDAQVYRVDTRDAFQDSLTPDLDVILADYTLPQFNALEALAMLHASGHEIPFIVVTGSVSEEAAVACMKKGATDYLLKDRMARLGPAVESALLEAHLLREKKKAEQALRHSEAFNRAILHSLTAHIAVIEEGGTIISVNEAWQRFARENGDPDLESTGVGMNYLAVLGRTGEQVQASAGIKSVLNGDASSYSLEYPCHSPDEQRWFQMMVTPLDIDKRAAVIAHHNITERKLAADKLKEAKERSEELSRLKSTFLNNMSHELRTPLTGIIGFSRLLEGNVHGEEEVYRQFIEQSGQQLLETLNSVLELSMLDSGTIELDLEALDVGAVVTGQTDVLRRQSEVKGLSLDVETPATPVQARLDRTSLERIINHLVGNAIKFTDEGGVTVRVTSAKDQVQIQVADTGIGIDPSFLPHIFDEFRQGSTGLTRAYGGNGIGLTNVRRLVDFMEGTVSVESQPGEGSVFTIRFPALVPAPAEAPRAHPGVKQADLAHILVVDDSATMRVLIHFYLRDRWEVGLAVNSEGAFKMAQSHSFDLVLLDIKLEEDHGGVEVLKKLRKDPAYRTVPFIAITGYALSGNRTRFLKKGFDDYLSKPFSKADLHDIISKHL
ncbi:MAG TPA: response regulator [Rhodothermales bacterium]|nr:response regulator [Rhodothermales bacterium]